MSYAAAHRLRIIEKGSELVRIEMVNPSLANKNMKKEDKNKIENNFEEINNYCEECKKEDESVSQNLILTGFKICNSCKISKTIFPI